MSLSINQIIAIRAPQYSNDPDLANTITLAEQLTDEDTFGDNYNYAVVLRTAHLLTLRDLNKEGVNSVFGGAVGAITSKREGDSAVTFSNPSGLTGTTGTKNGDLSLTRYGLELLGLIASNVIGFSVANYNDVLTNLTSEEE